MADYEAGATSLRESRYLTAPERWVALKRYDLNVARELTSGPAENPNAAIARSAFEGSFGLVIPIGFVMQLVFIAYLLLGPDTDDYLPAQITTMAIAIVVFTAAFLRGRAARRHFLQSD